MNEPLMCPHCNQPAAWCEFFQAEVLERLQYNPPTVPIRQILDETAVDLKELVEACK